MDNQTNEVNMTEGIKPRRHWFLRHGIWALLVVAVFFVGFYQGRAGFVFSPSEFKVVNQNEQPALVDYDLFTKVIDTLNRKFIGEDLNEQQVLYGAIKGAVSAAGDPYTEFFTPEELADFRTELKGSFEGIGAELGKRDGVLIVVAPIDGSPAQKAGVRAGDAIIRVDGQVATSWSVEEAVKNIRGAKGTSVKLSLARQGETAPVEITIVRDTIAIKSVKWEMKTTEGGKKVGYIKISRFGDDTNDLFSQAAKELKNQGATAIVLDLRNNPGGYLDSAVEVASHWLAKGTLVLTEEKSESDSVKYQSLGYGTLTGMPTIVLHNSGSASAAEILAGALRDQKAAQTLGEQSFGKGSVQEIVPLQGGGGLKVTIAKWVTPGGQNLNEAGLVPDFEVKMSADDYTNERDPQLEEALSKL